MFVGVLFFRLIANPDLNNSNETTIGNGLSQLQQNRGGRACLFILGFFLIVYGLFAVDSLQDLSLALVWLWWPSCYLALSALVRFLKQQLDTSSGSDTEHVWWASLFARCGLHSHAIVWQPLHQDCMVAGHVAGHGLTHRLV